MNEKQIIEALKNNKRGYCYLSDEEQEFLKRMARGDVHRVLSVGKFLLVDIDDVGVNQMAVLRLRPDFDPPRGGGEVDERN